MVPFMRKKSVIITASIILLLITATSIYLLQNKKKDNPTPASDFVAEDYFIYDTIVRVKVFGENANEQTLNDIGNLLHDLDNKMNKNKVGSEIDQINAAAGESAVKVSPDLFELISRSVQYGDETSGFFDIAIGPLVDLWQIGNEGAHVPKQNEINTAMALTSYKDIELNKQEHSVKLLRKGMVLDLGGIGKGYAAEQIRDYLLKHDLTSALINMGSSSIITVGKKLNGSDWLLGIQNPDQSRGNSLGTITLNNEVINTSGVYERFFMQDGVRYHHIFDPQTGYPIQNGLESVTIIGKDAVEAEALTKGIFVMGVQKGLKYIEGLDGVEALFITKDQKIHATSGLKNRLNITDTNYKVIY